MVVTPVAGPSLKLTGSPQIRPVAWGGQVGAVLLQWVTERLREAGTREQAFSLELTHWRTQGRWNVSRLGGCPRGM
jgi:hypothetical protein